MLLALLALADTSGGVRDATGTRVDPVLHAEMVRAAAWGIGRLAGRQTARE